MMGSLGGESGRVKIHSSPQRNPLNQQQTRPFTAYAPANITSPRPSSQIEALPPSQSPPSPYQRAPNPTPISGLNPTTDPQALISNFKDLAISLDPAKRHPVFFTDRLHKPPSGVGDGWVGGMSPVARGYVFNDGDVAKEREAERGARL